MRSVTPDSATSWRTRTEIIGYSRVPPRRTPVSRQMLILRTPSLMYNYSGIPPFGLATITAELKSKGFDIRQDDLDAKCAADELFPRHRWGKSFPAKDLMLDIERMRRFWEGGEE